MGEIGTVDDDEDVGRGLDHGSGGLLDQPQDLRQLLDDGGKPDDRELFDRKQRGQALARHRAAADALEPHRAAKALAQHLHQIGAEAIAGFLRRDQKDLPQPLGARASRRHADSPWMKSPALSAASIMACDSAAMVLPAMMAMPASPALATPSMVLGPTVGRSKRKSWPLLGAFTSTPRPVPGANTALAAQPRHARQKPVGALDVLDRHHMTVDHHDGLADVERTERAQHLPPSRDVGGGGRIGRRAGDASLGHQDFGRDILDADHPETVLLENAADPRQQMIVAAAKRRHDAAEDADRSPVQPDFRQRRPQQACR